MEAKKSVLKMKDLLEPSYCRKLQMILCPWDIICHGLSLCIAMLPASCFTTPHLLTAFSLRQKQQHLLKLQRQTIMDTVYPTLHYQAENLESPAVTPKPLSWLLTLLATSCAHLLTSNQQRVSRWGVTAGLGGIHPWPLYERLTKPQEPLIWLLRNGQELGSRQNKPPLLNTCRHCRFSHHSARCRQGALLRGIEISVPALSRKSFSRTFMTTKSGMRDGITTETIEFVSEEASIKSCNNLFFVVHENVRIQRACVLSVSQN